MAQPETAKEDLPQKQDEKKIEDKSKTLNKKQHMANLKKEMEMDQHTIELTELCLRLGTDIDKGLSTEVAAVYLGRDGPNSLTPPPDHSKWLMFLEQLFGGFQILLWIGSILCFISYGVTATVMKDPPRDNLYLGFVLASIVILTGIFAYYQEAKSSSIMDSFKKLVPQQATAIRNGETITLPVDKIVIGDIVDIVSGDRIPADVRVISASNFKVDNSALTGESEPQPRNHLCTSPNPMETRNIAFFTTMAVEGSARGIVINTGDRTIIGRIATLTSTIKSGDTPIRKEIDHFIKLITCIAFSSGLVVFFASIFMGNTWIDAVLFLIGVIIATVPEGLLPTVTVALTLTAKRMASKNCLVKNLEAVETLGSTSVICSDKTGTLTQNRMTVAHIWFDDVITEMDTTGTEINAEAMEQLLLSVTYRHLAHVGILCNKAEFEPDQDNLPIFRRECSGTGSEIGILKCFERYFGKSHELRKANPVCCEIPFNSTTKLHFVVRNIDNVNIVLMKGAPERVLDKCSTIMIRGQKRNMSVDWKNRFNSVYEELGGMGERVLGLCHCELDVNKFPKDFHFDSENPNFPMDGLSFLGLVAMIDPPRASVPIAVEKCKRSGIKVIMVTGDHPITATAIARAVGIIEPSAKLANDVAAEEHIEAIDVDPKKARAIVINGGELKNINTAILIKVVSTFSQIVFARTSPQQKLIIVEACQKSGKIVAVTGDGVNDSPALKQADIGIAMGIAGSDVSKQAADMILLDDNFASIVVGIEEGRIIFDNLKKTIAYTLSSKIPELTPFLMYLFVGIPLPLGPITILLIDLGTDLLPAIAVAYESAESDIMSRPPRDIQTTRLVGDILISVSYGHYGVYNAFAGFFTYFIIMGENGFLPWNLVGLRERWDAEHVQVIRDSYGQEWTYTQRKSLEYTAQTGYFVSIVVIQWVVLIVCKTRKNSFFHQGMYNWPMNLALLMETSLALLVSYAPCENILRTYPLFYEWWLPALPLAFFLFVQDEIRKYLIRTLTPGNWVERETYY